MKDASGTELNVGDIVVVVDGIEGFINDGDYYTVEQLLESAGRIAVNPDARGLEGHYLARRFLKVEVDGQVVS